MGLSSPGHTAVGTDMGRENGAGKFGPCGLTTLIEAPVQCANIPYEWHVLTKPPGVRQQAVQRPG